MNDPNQSYVGHYGPIALHGAFFPLQTHLYPIISSQTVVTMVPGFMYLMRGLHGCSTPVIALTAACCSPTLHFPSLHCVFQCVLYMYMPFHQWWATPSGLLPLDSHQTMTSVLVWDTGRPNGDQRHPLVPVGPLVQSTAATCLAAAVACPHYGPNTTTSFSMGQGYSYSAFKSM